MSKFQQQIAFWDAGAPRISWIDLLNARTLAGITDDNERRERACTPTWRSRCTTPTIAAWESKYRVQPHASERARSQAADGACRSRTVCHRNPSEHAASARAAASVLAHFVPAEAQSFQSDGRSRRAGRRVLAGLQYPSDYYAEARTRQESGRAGDREGEARSARTPFWTGTVPIGCMQRAVGTNPGNVTGANLCPAVDVSERVQTGSAAAGMRLASGSSPRRRWSTISSRAQERPHIRTNYKACLLAKPGRSPMSGLTGMPTSGCSKMDRSELPRAARVYALIGRGAVRCLHRRARMASSRTGTLRPPQLDPAIVPLLPGAELSELPLESLDVLRRRNRRCWRTCSRRMRTSSAPLARRPAISRIWAGIHYPDGQRRRCAARKVRRPGLHRVRRRTMASPGGPVAKAAPASVMTQNSGRQLATRRQ